MTHSSWNAIISSNRFYINSYRKLISILAISVLINSILGLSIFYFYFTQGEPDFYATNGETPPILLSSLNVPNEGANALLAPDVNSETEMKALPE